jgi:SAM-dependent methyltransferase
MKRIAFLVAAWAVAQAPARTPDIFYVPSRHAVADGMLQFAKVTKDDVVYDLGSGDGRIAILAAQKYGARAVGIELDPKLVALARQIAADSGVSDRVTFIEADLFTSDISKATVVTLYLSTSVNARLEPKLRSELRPGTRVVSQQFLIGQWAADEKTVVSDANLYLWRIPAR